MPVLRPLALGLDRRIRARARPRPARRLAAEVIRAGVAPPAMGRVISAVATLRPARPAVASARIHVRLADPAMVQCGPEVALIPLRLVGVLHGRGSLCVPMPQVVLSAGVLVRAPGLAAKIGLAAVPIVQVIAPRGRRVAPNGAVPVPSEATVALSGQAAIVLSGREPALSGAVHVSSAVVATSNGRLLVLNAPSVSRVPPSRRSRTTSISACLIGRCAPSCDR
jgi:hypothetical protein